jgi:hypothetical protein
MKRLHTATVSCENWRERLARPDTQWVRTFSAFEAAVSWEGASATVSGLPTAIFNLLDAAFGDPKLLLAIAEHKVSLPGGNADSQNDVWALVKTATCTLSLSIEARESFGNETLEVWLIPDNPPPTRLQRWNYIRDHLPHVQDGAYLPIAYQLLHRCACAVIEAKRFGLKYAACIVQAFETPNIRYGEFSEFCNAIGINVPRGGIQNTAVGDITLAIGWADCPCATDAQIAAIA